jgi:ABC-type antimicrobial peptide transport system permease subunit
MSSRDEFTDIVIVPAFSNLTLNELCKACSLVILDNIASIGFIDALCKGLMMMLLDGYFKCW